ncbi:8814_t:CDS:2, partial [Funneliformis caledonium]
ELEEYLRKPVAHEVTYPHLATMAQDFLAIPGTSVPVERVFSSGADLLAKKRYNLGKESIQA